MSDEQSAVDRDSLHILPLTILPLETPSLSRARMIKNARLESMVEMFQNKSSGSGQLRVTDLPSEFEWREDENRGDLKILTQVADLPSYDVYSLRISLRDLGIKVEDHTALRLSEEMNAELSTYMTEFTRPLIMQIYGDDQLEIQSFADIVQLFRDPDIERALARLRTMADKLGIQPEDVPKFIEDYGDIFLSLAYYRRCLEIIDPVIDDFIEALGTLKKNVTLLGHNDLMTTIGMMEKTVAARRDGTTRLINDFENSTQNMWDDISADSFESLRQMITSYHTTVGAVLCSLTVKMDAWARKFPGPDRGSPAKRSEFIMAEMRQGMDQMRKMREDRPMMAGLGQSRR